MSTALLNRAPWPTTILGVGSKGFTAAVRPYRVRRGHHCPVCGQDTEFIVIPDPHQTSKHHVWCTRGQGFDGGTFLDGLGFKSGIWYFFRDEATGVIHRPAPTRHHEIPLVDADTIDRVLSATATFFGLSDEHRAMLAQRGYDASACGPEAHHVFASLPADRGRRAQVAAWLMYKFADERDLLGSLGYGCDRRRTEAPIEFLGYVAGGALLEFRCDAQGRLTGFQYAPDTPEVDRHGRPKKRLSPLRMVIADQCHVAYPEPEQDQGIEVWHTEAIHKSNITSDRRQALALGSLGVGNIGGLVAGARATDPEARRVHVLAIDADHWGSKNETELATRLYDAGYRIALARWDPALGNGPDDALVAGATITLTPWQDGRAKPRTDQRLTHAYPWQHRQVSPAAQHAALAATSQHIAQRVEQHITHAQGETLVVIAPPGVGKSTAVAALGERNAAYPLGHHSLAWIAQRHNMVQSVAALQTYLHIAPATVHNCPEAYTIHERVAARGYKTSGIHQQHNDACQYSRQWLDEGSAVFQLAHVKTRYPTEKRAIVVDEMDLASWLPERELTLGQIAEATHQWPADSTAEKLLRALQNVITDVARDHQALQGRAFFEQLDLRCGGFLAAWIGELAQNERATNRLPYTEVDIYDIGAVEAAEHLPRVILPHIMAALLSEYAAWQLPGEWNSRIRIALTRESAVLHITEPLQFGGPRAALPPLTILDATADEEIFRLLFPTIPVTIERAEVTPPPATRHIAIRTGKRYGKTALTAHDGRGRDRAIAEARYILRDLDPDGSLATNGRVGVITFADIEQDVREALGIPAHVTVERDGHTVTLPRSGHFWAMRGSNDLEDVEILLIIGTPALRPDEVIRMSRALWRSDTAIDETCEQIDGHWTFRDPRAQRLATYLIQAELTQCAHRNRPLRHDGRTVVTLCDSTIDFLPMTTEITQLPRLTLDGDERTTKQQQANTTRMTTAVEVLRTRGEVITVRTIAATARVSMRDASVWLREQGENGIVCVLPKQQLDLYSHSGNVQTIPMHPPSASSVAATTLIVSTHIPPPSVAPPPIALGERVAHLERATLPPPRAHQTLPEPDAIASSKGLSL